MMMTTTSKKGCLRYEDADLDEDSLKKIKQELQETEENKKKCLAILKKKLIATKDLNANLSDNFLLAFLRVAKYDIDKAYPRLIKYYEDRISMPEAFNDYSPSSVERVINARQFKLSPYRSKKDNSAILFLKRGHFDPSKHPYELIIRYWFLTFDFALLENLNQLCGVTIIIDMATSSSANSWKEVTPGKLKLTARVLQKSLPLRIRAVHIINAPAIFSMLYSIIYPFLSAKIRNRIYVHRNCANLHEFVDPEVLPKEYEGLLEQTDLIDVFEKLLEKEDYFNKVSKYGFIKKK